MDIVLIKSILSLIKNSNHKGIGIYYLLTGLICGLIGLLLSLLIRIELYSSSNRIISSENTNYYNVSITIHALLMIFFLVMPVLYGGFTNYFLPILQGSPEVIYPRLNNLSIYLLILSYLYIIISIFSEYGLPSGWTLYPPLSTSYHTLSPSSLYYIILSLLLSGISSILTSINFYITIINLKSYSLSYKLLLLYIYTIIITTSLLLFTLPILTATLIILFSDLNINTLFFDSIYGGDPILYQHLFWFFGHPEVYILILPTFGLTSLILSTTSLLYAYQSMIFTITSISFLGSIVWGHHMYTTSLQINTRSYFTSLTILISLPTGTKIFNWLSTYLSTTTFLHLSSPYTLFTILFLIMFTIGGSTGIILANSTIDLILHDTYYIPGHFHFVLSLGAIISIFSSTLYLYPYLISTNTLFTSTTTSLSLYHLLLTFTGILFTFIPMHFLGFNIMPRRILDFPDTFHSWNFLSSIGSGITLLSFSIFIDAMHQWIEKDNSKWFLKIR